MMISHSFCSRILSLETTLSVIGGFLPFIFKPCLIAFIWPFRNYSFTHLYRRNLNIMHNFKEQNIFIVDDEELILKAMKRQLEKMDFENIQTFDNGQDCVNALDDKPFVVLLDYEMEGLNGFEVLRKIKRYNPNIYVIMMSAQESINNAVSTLKFGAFDYIVKGDNEAEKLKSALDRIYKIERQILSPRKSVFSRILSIT